MPRRPRRPCLHPGCPRFRPCALHPTSTPYRGSSTAQGYDALGIAFQDDLARQAKRAKESPAFRNTFLRLHLNRWTKQQTTWLPMERWDATAGLVNLAEIEPDRHCTIAAWLASSTELATVVVLFRPETESGEYVVHMDTFAPADNIDALADRDQLPYREWVEQGWLTLTEGDIIDFTGSAARSSTATPAATRSTRSPATRAAPCSSCSSSRPRTRPSSRCSRALPR